MGIFSKWKRMNGPRTFQLLNKAGRVRETELKGGLRAGRCLIVFLVTWQRNRRKRKLGMNLSHWVFITCTAFFWQARGTLVGKIALLKTPLFCASFCTVLGQRHSQAAHLFYSFTSGMHYLKDLEAIKDDSSGSHGLPSLRVGLETIQTDRAPPLSWNKKAVSGGSRTEKLGGVHRRKAANPHAQYLVPPKEPP